MSDSTRSNNPSSTNGSRSTSAHGRSPVPQSASRKSSAGLMSPSPQTNSKPHSSATTQRTKTPLEDIPQRNGSADPTNTRDGGSPSASSPPLTSTGKKKKKGSGSTKSKKKKKPIIEEPKFVRDLITHAESNDLDWVRHFLSAGEYHLKYDLAATAGEALVKAATKNHVEMVELLVKTGGASPNLLNGKALQRAALAGSLEASEALVRLGADVNTPSNFSEYTPLHYAAQVGSTPLIRFLLSAGANVDAKCHIEQCGIHNGWSALHFSADAGHIEVVSTLLESGASIDIHNANEESPVAIAAERGQWEVVRWLVASGANIHSKRRGLSVVQWAIYRGDPDAIQFLVSYGAQPELNVKCLWFRATPFNPNAAPTAAAPSSVSTSSAAASSSSASASSSDSQMTLKDLIYRQFSEDIYDQIDLSIYRGGKQAMEREAKKKLLSTIEWESTPVFDPYSFETIPQSSTRNFPPHIVSMISSYEM